MATCPFATQKPIGSGSGGYTGGPFKIIHHTTEGSGAAGAFAAYASGGSEPHFTVDSATVYQHLDTKVGARALRNPAGGVETNRQSALQIEIVGYAGKAKDKATLERVARLCRWLEATHGVANAWPNGAPKPPRNGADPGGHNRDAANWTSMSGHYGHSQVPENTHWDPAYTAAEWEFVTKARFSPTGQLLDTDLEALLPAEEGLADQPFEVMEDHGAVHDAEDSAR